MLVFILLIMNVVALAYPLGKYLAAVMQNQTMRIDPLFNWIEKPIYILLGTNPKLGMSVKTYTLSFVLSCMVLGGFTWVLFMTQANLPLNPNQAPNMSWDLALHTMISFLTNTNQQHYSGQAQLSYLSQMVGIVGLQIITPMMGLAMVVATVRALFYKQSVPLNIEKNTTSGTPLQGVNVGNYWADVIRPTFRFLIPLCMVWSLLLTSQGVPSTFQGGPEVQVLDQTAELHTQKIPLGPVAPMVAVKQLGSNGGGWYGPNSSVPLENPTPLSNFLEMLAILLIPVSVIFMLGFFTKRTKFAVFVFASMLLMSIISASSAIWSESISTTAAQLYAMEGKEVRFGEASSALWSALTTQVNNGSVNMMHDSSAPLTGLIALANMLINAIWGGIGCGLQQFIIYLFLAVFIAGLMIGRTPELFGRKIEAGEIKLLAVVILIQPITILTLTAITLYFPTLTGNSNPQYHAVSQVLYEYVSAFANNGSGFEGLADNTIWWNLSTSLALVLGRFPTLIIPLFIAARLASKRQAPESSGSLKVETPTFALTLIAIVVMLTLLQFMPVLVLGPIADHLLLVKA
ncbi:MULTISPECIES: potassium-transporting ATPase subunit KdpA [Acinetobacter]|jgi:potassium-transporting ATPase potassium-binding subunit|uniref:potassium-transporting ATPase subunit KdpA n=1 Tax=Acinetobacter TaxID=469 RepID=UPI0008F54016|nr:MULTISPECIES: potassium-transporting ATPase subunit KdpA [Acinetobacter]MDT0198688.1 potassium-transporting ATPase subunit KdpA [Acinetobacter sp. RG5]MDT0230058.1 potassium-transporting ATPase subunit KdpA [Acinetobacter sp. RRD8]OIJ36149.1 potassium-transporting ATPase subunit KdpA [Acinetobacter sp. LCT-H3]